MTFTVDRIDHVVLNCRDVEQTADWYVRVLGMRREVFGEGRIALVFGSQKLNVRPTGAPNWTTGVIDAPGALGPMTSHYCRDPDGNLVEVASYRRPD